MTSDPSRELFQNYLRQYQDGGAGRAQIQLEQIKAFRLDRLPRWLDRIPRDAHILDAGCATGYMLSLLWESGYYNLFGVELSEQLAQIAKSLLPSDANVTVSDIRDFLVQTPAESFDVILFHHVLEHIPREHTITLLREFHRVLKPGGYLNIRVPNASSLLAGHHLFGDFTHIVYFNERSLLQVLEAANYDTSCIEFILHPPFLFWSWRHILRALLRHLNYVRWHLHRVLHKVVCALIDLYPPPKYFEWELDVLARK